MCAYDDSLSSGAYAVTFPSLFPAVKWPFLPALPCIYSWPTPVAMATNFEIKKIGYNLACIRDIFKMFASNQEGVFGDRLLNKVNLMLPRSTIVTMAMTFVEFGQKITRSVVVTVVVVFKLFHLAEICTLTSAF